MELFDYVIAGSGPAGVAAARRLAGRNVCIVDVGEEPAQSFPHATLEDALAAGDRQALLGPGWEMLANIVHPLAVHSKLRSVGIRHIASGRRFVLTGQSSEACLVGAGSHAAGGMSNAWGAQLFRYGDRDLDEVGGWPITAGDLTPYYADLERHIGIAGVRDDMEEFLGGAEALLPPVPMVPSAAHLMARYANRARKDGLLLGRSRLAVLTKPYVGHKACGFGETEFFTTGQPGIYTATRTLNALRKDGQVVYRQGLEVESYAESPEFVEIRARACGDGRVATLRAKHLLLACGTVQTARLVLMAKQAFGRRLPFLDHPPTLVPLFLPGMFGSPLPTRSFPVQLVATLGLADQPRDMISVYYPGGLLYSDLLSDVPLPLDGALQILPSLLGGMLVAQIWEMSRPHPNNGLSIDHAGEIRICYSVRQAYPRLGPLLKAFRCIGAYSMQRLAKMSLPGWGFHYAGCLPMKSSPAEFETHPDGRLWDSRRVRVVDGCVLPSLPAKNHSFTIMANAARVADEVLRCGY